MGKQWNALELVVREGAPFLAVFRTILEFSGIHYGGRPLRQRFPAKTAFGRFLLFRAPDFLAVWGCFSRATVPVLSRLSRSFCYLAIVAIPRKGNSRDGKVFDRQNCVSDYGAMLTIAEFARRENLGDERVRQLCKEGRIAGAKKIGDGRRGIWFIPATAMIERRAWGRPRKVDVVASDSNARLVQGLVRAAFLDDEKRLEECRAFMNASAERGGTLFYKSGCWGFGSMEEKNRFDEERLANHIAKTAMGLSGL